MRVLITTVQVPFVRGGGEILAEGLRDACRSAGNQAEILTTPFRFGPNSELRRSMAFWSQERLGHFDSGPVDRVIHLKFPCFYASHPHASLWLLHQHRAAYELWDTPYAGFDASDPDAVAIRADIIAHDSAALARIPTRYTIGTRVTERLRRFNGVEAAPLFHPPYRADAYYCAESMPFVFCPSRLEGLKRQELLIEAMAKVRSPLVAVIAGEGGMRAILESKIAALGVSDRVRIVGRLDDEEMLAYYANCRAVFFAPYDEDYGYVTLEAMLSRKPVITCTDSGGPLDFVVPGQTGAVCEPDASAIAAALDHVCADAGSARKLGAAGHERYQGMGISWRAVVERLLA